MQHYYAVAEPDEAGGFWISFPAGTGSRPQHRAPSLSSVRRATHWSRC